MCFMTCRTNPFRGRHPPFLPHLQTIYCNWWDAEEPRNSSGEWRVTSGEKESRAPETVADGKTFTFWKPERDAPRLGFSAESCHTPFRGAPWAQGHAKQ